MGVATEILKKMQNKKEESPLRPFINMIEAEMLQLNENLQIETKWKILDVLREAQLKNLTTKYSAVTSTPITSTPIRRTMKPNRILTFLAHEVIQVHEKFHVQEMPKDPVDFSNIRFSPLPNNR